MLVANEEMCLTFIFSGNDELEQAIRNGNLEKCRFVGVVVLDVVVLDVAHEMLSSGKTDPRQKCTRDSVF